MLEIFKKLTASAKPPTAAEFRAARDEIDEAALVATVAEAEAEVREAILSGAEKAVERAEQQSANARRNLDRARAAREALGEKIAAAEAAEAGATLERERVEVEVEAEKVAARLRKEYASASRIIVSVLNELEVSEDRVRRVNEKLTAAGMPPVAPVEERAFPVPPSLYAPVASVISMTALRPVPGSRGWGGPVETFQRLGLTE